MDRKISPQSKSFIVLFSVAVVGTVVCAGLARYLTIRYQDDGYTLYPYPPKYLVNKPMVKQPPTTPPPPQSEPVVPTVDTSDWKVYTASKYNFQFRYDPSWNIKNGGKKDGYDILEVDPGKKYYNFKIYVSPTDYYIVDGLPATDQTIGGKQAKNIQNMLYAIQDDNLRLTFDLGMSLSLRPQFKAMVESLKFTDSAQAKGVQ